MGTDEDISRQNHRQQIHHQSNTVCIVITAAHLMLLVVWSCCRAQGLGDSRDELQSEIDSLRSDVALLQSELAARWVMFRLHITCYVAYPVHSWSLCGSYADPVHHVWPSLVFGDVMIGQSACVIVSVESSNAQMKVLSQHMYVQHTTTKFSMLPIFITPCVSVVAGCLLRSRRP